MLAAMACGMAAALPARAAQPVTHEAVINAIAGGKDASALLQNVENRGSGGAAVRNTNGKQLAHALNAMANAVNGGDAARIVQAHEAVIASAMLVQSESRELKTRLADPALPSDFETRRAAVERQIELLLQRLAGAMPGLAGTVQQKAESLAALRAALETGARARRADVQVLRAASLPVRPLALAARAPQTSPAIVPSYQSTQEVAAEPKDIADAPEAPLSEEILAKAKELGYDYVRIYEYVRNNVRSEWYAGSSKGALGALRTGRANSVDQASLLIALMRAAGAPARYVRGVAEVDVATIASAAGLRDANLVPDMLTKAGVAFAPVIQGGRVALVRIEHTWVAVQVPYTNYRGIVLDTTGKTWLPLDVFYKALEPLQAAATFTSLGVDLQGLAVQYRAQVQSGDFGGFVRERVNATSPTAYETATAPATIRAQTLGLLPNTLGFSVIAVTGESAALPSALQSTVRLRLFNNAAGSGDAGLDVTLPVHELFNQRATINYIPADLADHRAILLAGGLDLAPAYLFRYRPEFRLDGFQRNVGLTPLGGGDQVKFRLDIQTPAATQTVEQTFIVGAYHAIGVGQGNVARNPQRSPRDGEYDAARLLDGIVQRYENQLDSFEQGARHLSAAAVVHPTPSVTIVSNALNVYSVNAVPFTLEWKGVTMDAATRATEVTAADAATARTLQNAIGLAGSSLEQGVFASQFGVNSISADKLIALARSQDIKVLTLTSPSAPEIANLPLADAIKADFRAWLQSGYTVEVPVQPVTYEAWSGMGWIVSDPATGASGYYLSGGIAGGATAQLPWTNQFLADALAGAHSDAPNNDPSSGVSVEILGVDGDLRGTAGQVLAGKPMSVRVRDKEGRPVKGATVTFMAVRGGGSVNPTSATTNALGVATTMLTLGRSTREAPVYIQRNPADKHVTQVGLNFFDATAASSIGLLRPPTPLGVLALPGAPSQIKSKQVLAGSATPGMATVNSNFSIEVTDQYANPVANVPVSGVGLPPTSTCDPVVPTSPATVDGPYETNTFGVAFLSVTPGPTNGTVSPVQVTAGGLSTTVSVRVDEACDASAANLHVFTYGYFDKDGSLAAATGLGKRFDKPFRIQVYQERAGGPARNSRNECVWTGTRTFQPATNATVSPSVTSGGRALGAASIGPGAWETFVATGASPAENLLRWSVGGKYTVDTRGSDCATRVPLEVPIGNATFGNLGSGVFGVRATVSSIASAGVPAGIDPSILHLSDAGLNVYPIKIDFTLEPPTFKAPAVQMRIFEDAQLIAVRPSTDRQQRGEVPIERGNRFDIARNYYADAYISDDIISEKVLFPFKQRIVTTYERMLRLARDVDIANDRFCAQGSALNFTLAQSARITLEVTRLSDDVDPVPTGTPIRLVQSQAFAAGPNSIPLAPDALLPTKNGYVFKLIAVSDKDGTVEPNEGRVVSTLLLNDALPVGNILVNGVNVKSGRINLSGMGFGVAARGPQLALRPTYSSGGPGNVGVLGVNWGHNFDASLATTACGDILINAGDGGFVRFLPQPNGTLTPAKGYHGTLIANGTDQSYDFYSKDGTRYHFTFIGGKRQWALKTITDTNGNTLTLTYDTGVDAPLHSVQNSYGQSLAFIYQTRSFIGAGAPATVLQSIQGPEGLGLAFDYDPLGNLTKITRTDKPEASETFAYSDQTGPMGVPNLLLSHSNALGQSTQFSYNSGPVMRTFGNGQIPSFESTVIAVTTADNAKTTFDYSGDPSAPITAVTDALGNVTRYTFNKYGNPLAITGPAGTTSMTWASHDVVMLSKTDANGVVTNFTYDENGNQTSEQVMGPDGATSAQTWMSQTAPPFIKNKRLSLTDRRSLTANYSYDARGNLTGEQLPDGSRISHSVAANGDRQSTTDAMGKTTNLRYDERGMRNAVIDALGGTTSTRYDKRGRPVAVVDAEGRTTEMQYTTLDQLTSVKQATGSPVGGTKTATWDVLGNKLTETDEEGRNTSYNYDAMNRVVRKARPIGAIAITYDLLGNKTSESNLRGDVTTYGYDGANRLVRRTEPATPPKVTGYAYDGVGNITTETDALGRQTTHTYNTLNQLTSTKYPDGTTSRTSYDGNGNKTSETDALGRVTTYAYDNLNRLTSQTLPGQSTRSMVYDNNGNLTSRTDANGNKTSFEYDALNRLVSETDALRRSTFTDYDKVGNKLQATNPLRQARKWQYNERNWMVATQDEEGHRTQYTYDRVGNQLTESWPNGNTVTRQYDALNRRTRSSDNLGQLSATTYDADGNITSQSDGRGNATTATWDAIGRQLTRTQPTAAGNATTSTAYDAAGNATSVTTPSGNVITTQYDQRNRPVEVRDSVGAVSATTYDDVGNALTQTDGRGRVLTHQYNEHNLRASTRDTQGLLSSAVYDPHGNKTSETDANGHTTAYRYDALNHVTHTTRAGVQLQVTEYDEAGRVQFETDARGNKIGHEYDKRGLPVKTNRSLGAIDQLQRDSMGDVTLATDPEGRTTATQYDARRRAIRVTDGVGNATHNTYDLAGNLTEVKTPLGGTTSYTYESANRLATISQPLASGPAQASRTYDTSGNLVAQTDLNGHATGYTYDARNRRTQKTLPGGAEETNGYDQADGLTSHTDANGNRFAHTLDTRGQRTQTVATPSSANSAGSITQTTYAYDANGNLTRTTQTDPWGARTETTTYDAFNRPVQVTDAWGNSLTHSYDAQGNRTGTTARAQTGGSGSAAGSLTTIEYDALNRITSQSGAGGLTRISYDRSSRGTSVLHPDYSSTTTSYDRAGRVATEASSTQASPGAGNTIRSSAYSYDANGNRTASTTVESLSATNRSASLSAHLPGGANPGSHSRTRAETWTYDPQDRLTSHTTPERTTTWQLDAGGRRIQQTVVATAGATGPPGNDLEAATSAPAGTLSYSYNSRDQLTQISGVLSASYTYDANGNRLSQTKTRGAQTQTTRYHWNAQDQLVQVEQGSGSTPPDLLASYRYPADNLRAEKLLTDLGLTQASQSSPAAQQASTPLAYERTQWDGLHARRSYEVTGANNNLQTLRSDTDAAVMPGNTAPILFNRTTYANGLGSASSTTQLHADSQGTLIATVVSEAGSPKANSLLHY
ncbi:MAG: transglutaminase domain-containing protein, partial [Acidovorax sp.]|nr:transglutaminase domain-containing protein [Acidovorax sp.]